MDDIRKIYIAATRQNDGKTITALGLFNIISEKIPQVGYIKPVGQHVQLIGNRKIDKDANLMNEVYQIGAALQDMSPVTVPRGFTEEYILKGDVNQLKDTIKQSYERASRDKNFLVIEGTGHAGVGSIFDLSNAAVAKLLNARVVLVTSGGIGRPIDEVMLNKALFDQHGVELLGVIVNKVLPEKFDKIDKFVRLGFQRKGIRVFGVMPYWPILSSPTLRQLLEDIEGAQLISGENNLDQSVSKMVVGAMPAHTALEYFKGDVLLITPGNREDLILAAITCCVPGMSSEYNVKGIILTGSIRPHKSIMKVIENANLPIILVDKDTYTVAQKITNLIIKIRAEDKEKIAAVKELIKKYVDVPSIIQNTATPIS